MGLRALIGAVMRSVAALVLVPVEMIVDGIRVVRRVLGIAPAAPMGLPMADVAEEVVAESDGEKALREAALAGRRHAQKLSEGERIRRAAGHLRRGQPVPCQYLDPAKEAEAEVLLWLAELDEIQLGRVTMASDQEIAGHLAGVRMLQVPSMPRFEAIEEEKRSETRPLTYEQWCRHLARLAAEAGDDDCADRILDEAERLAESGATLADYRAENPPPARAMADVSVDDDADVG